MFTFNEIRNPVWGNSEHTVINCDVSFDQIEGITPFTANKNEPLKHTQEIFNAIISGVYGEITEYAAPLVLTATPASGQIPFTVFNETTGIL